MGTTKINQKEYLKKYLGGGNDAKKKKKKKLKVGLKKVKIIDDDVDLKSIRPLDDGEFDILNTTEDAPQIAGIIDERGPVDFTDKARWKIIADDGEGNIAITSSSNQQDNIRDVDISNGPIEDRSQKSHLKRKEKDYSDNDQDLPRKLNKVSTNDLSPPRKSSSQQKKVTKKRRRKRSTSTSESSSDSSSSSSSSDSSPQRKSKSKKHSSKSHKSNKYDSDLSPPRPSRKHTDDKREFSQRQDVDSDLSPPRKSLKDTQKKDRDRDHRRSRRNNSDSDLSPPRKSSGNRSREVKMNRGDDCDLSPPRKLHSNSRHHKSDSNKNFEVIRRDRDKSPHRRKSRWADESRRSASPQIDRRMKKTLDGKTAGLQDAIALKEETAAYKRRETEFFNQMSAEVSGEGKAAVLRDRKTGRRRNLEAEAAERREKEKRQEEIDAKYAKWGKGLKQVDDQTEKLKQDLYEMSKPLARYADDADLDAQLRAVEREGDPMMEYIKQKQIKEGKREPDRPNYQGSFMPNRFGIKPGHRWDGVDRSNGYEKKWFEARNAKTALQEEAYKWSTSDM